MQRGLSSTALHSLSVACPLWCPRGTFLKQFKDVASICQEKGIKIVTNAGGLNPVSMAEKVEEITHELGLSLKVAHIDGDDLIPRLDELNNEGELLKNIEKDIPLAEYAKKPVTANAYFGAWGIKEALDKGADGFFFFKSNNFIGVFPIILHPPGESIE